MTVAPAEVLTKRLFSAAAIGWALALFGLSLLPPASVRELVSPLSIIGTSSVARWVTLQRWIGSTAARALFPGLRPSTKKSPTRRELAEHFAKSLGSYAIPTPDPPSATDLAFFGAARAP